MYMICDILLVTSEKSICYSIQTTMRLAEAVFITIAKLEGSKRSLYCDIMSILFILYASYVRITNIYLFI